MIDALSRHSRCVIRSGARGECKFLVDGVSVVRPDTLHWTWQWPAVCVTALSMTASCLSTLSEFESLLGVWKIDALDLKPSAGLVSLSSTPSYMRPSRLILDPSQIWAFPACLAKNWPKMKIPNLNLSVFLRGSVSRVYQLQDRIIMRYLNCPNPENTHSIKKLLMNM